MQSASGSAKGPLERRLFALLREWALERRDVKLASGLTSSVYFDCKQVILTGEGHHLVGRIFWDRLQKLETETGARHDAVGGMSIGADPLSSALALTAYEAGRELPAIFVRKESKGHGTGSFLEGLKRVPSGGRVVLVEDVVTTGGSSLQAVARLREGGFVVEHVLAILDRQAGGEEAFQREGLAFHPLFSLDAFVTEDES